MSLKRIILFFCISTILIFTSCKVKRGIVKMTIPPVVQAINDVTLQKIATDKNGTKQSILIRFFNPRGIGETKDETIIVNAIENQLNTIFAIKDRAFFNESLLRGTMSLDEALRSVNSDYLLELTIVESIRNLNTFYVTKRKHKKEKAIKRYPYAVQTIEAKMFDKSNVLIADFLFYYGLCSGDAGCAYKIRKKEGLWYLVDHNNTIIDNRYQNKPIELKDNVGISTYATEVIAPTIFNTFKKYF